MHEGTAPQPNPSSRSESARRWRNRRAGPCRPPPSRRRRSRVDANFAIQAGSIHGVFFDSTTVNAGELVTFGVIATPQQIHGNSVITAADSTQWRFVADDGEVTTGCPSISGSYCNVVMTKAGTMHVSGYVNGVYKPEARAVHVTVVTPQLSVNCAPATPVRGIAVSCTAATSDSSPFTVKRLKSVSADGRVIVDSNLTTVPLPNPWRGLAIVPTRVEITATVGGKDTVAIGSFGVQSRIGRTTGWLDEDFPDTQFPAAPPNQTYVKGNPAPFTESYPGFVFGVDTLLAKEGALGVTVFIYPQDVPLAAPGAGPNKGVIFVTSVPWISDERYPGFGVGIYLEQSTLSSDPFYKKQKGPAPKCTQADMAQIHSVLLAHEQRHWNTARTKLSGINYVRTLDCLIAIPPQTLSAIDTIQIRLRDNYRDSMTKAVNVTHAFTDIYPDCQVK